jgi:FdhD protein
VTTEAARHTVTTTRVVAVRDGRARERTDELAGEEPMEIRAAGPGQAPVRVAVTMRTPGHDFELAAGFLITEGLVQRDAVEGVAYCEDPDAQRYNVVTVRTRTPFDMGTAERNFFATSSCGICGKGALEAIAVRCAPLGPGPTIRSDVLLAMPDVLREHQRVFDRTGGLHAAGLFDTDGALRLVREDVGRHNAVDKAVGAMALGTGSGGAVLLVSGRLSFEIVQKAAVARIPIICAISAPSSLAVQAAEDLGLTAVGFLRADGFNIYSHPERVRSGVVD